MLIYYKWAQHLRGRKNIFELRWLIIKNIDKKVAFVHSRNNVVIEITEPYARLRDLSMQQYCRCVKRATSHEG